MGTSTDAILFYGYCWDEEERLEIAGQADDATEDEWTKVVLARRGIQNPWDGYPEGDGLSREAQRAASDKWVADNREAIDAYGAEHKKVMEEFGCEIDGHCHIEYSMPLVCIAESKRRAYRGHPQEIEQHQFEVKPEWAGMLTTFMSELGIKPPQESPRWWLVSYWG